MCACVGNGGESGWKRRLLAAADSEFAIPLLCRSRSLWRLWRLYCSSSACNRMSSTPSSTRRASRRLVRRETSARVKRASSLAVLALSHRERVDRDTRRAKEPTARRLRRRAVHATHRRAGGKLTTYDGLAQLRTGHICFTEACGRTQGGERRWTDRPALTAIGRQDETNGTRKLVRSEAEREKQPWISKDRPDAESGPKLNRMTRRSVAVVGEQREQARLCRAVAVKSP